MDIYSSTASLVSTNKQDKTLYPSKRSIVQNELGRESKRRKKRGQNGGGYAGMMIVGVLNLAMVIAITIIGAVYISHLQEHVSRLEQRVEVLEARSCDFDKKIGDNGRIEDETEGIEVRLRRHDLHDDEPEHIRADHHGIPSYDIAMVFGDSAKIRLKDPNEPREHQFEVDTKSPDRSKCGTLYERRDGQKYCTADTKAPGRRIARYVTSGQNQMYNYFKKASWMNQESSIEHYNLTHDGEIVVQHEGIYIVHASVFFMDLDKRDSPSYGVYKKDWLGNNRKLLSKCVVSMADKVDVDASGVYPCQAWQLTHLSAGDKVFMSIRGYAWFQIEKETLHLALIRLNDLAQV